MLKRKYSRDYKMRTTIGPDGRPRKVADYIGTEYRFCLSADVRRPAARRLFGAGLLGCLAYLQPISTVNQLSSVTSSLILHLCCVFPLGFLLWCLFQSAFASEPLTRETADKLTFRYLPSACICVLLSAASFVSDVSWLCSPSGSAAQALDITFAVCDACLCLLGYAAVFFRKYAQTEKIK